MSQAELHADYLKLQSQTRKILSIIFNGSFEPLSQVSLLLLLLLLSALVLVLLLLL